jgi:alcohol dehydrogenase (NADP+)
MDKRPFRIADDNIDPDLIPYKVLYTGAKIPGIGLGTFGSDRYSGEEIAAAVKEAIAMGYRHIDCASIYGNEHLIGESLREVLESGLVKRDELFITSKLWNDMHGNGDVLISCARTLKDLKLEYLDLYLIHWPFPNHHAPSVGSDSRDPDAKPYIYENYMKVWRQMERLVDAGLVRHIGTSNMTIPKLELVLQDARIRPAVNQMELHPHFQQPELFQYCLKQNIVPIGYCPVGSPKRPHRDRTPGDTVDTEDPVIIRIAERLNVHPAVVCIKWAVQRGQIPIPFSTTRSHLRSNLLCTVTEPLTEEEMRDIEKADRNCRLIKGHVFLWEGAKDWTDLWDVDGVIAGTDKSK